MALPVADPVTFKGVIAPFRSKETIVGDQQQHGFLPGDEKTPIHLPFDLPDPGIGLGPYVEGPELGRMALFPDLHSPLIRTAFLDRSVPKIQIQENYFGEDLPRMA